MSGSVPRLLESLDRAYVELDAPPLCSGCAEPTTSGVRVLIREPFRGLPRVRVRARLCRACERRWIGLDLSFQEIPRYRPVVPGEDLSGIPWEIR